MAAPINPLPFIKWFRAQDIGIDDVALRKQYNEYVDNNDFSNALLLLIKNSKTPGNGNSQLLNKIYESKLFTMIVNGILNLESVYIENVPNYLDTLLNEFNTNQVWNNFKVIGEWSAFVPYNPLNFVYHKQHLYMAISTSTNVEPGKIYPGKPVWIDLGDKTGLKGSDSPDVHFRGEWNTTTEYVKNDVVTYENNLYVCHVTSSTNENPATSISWSLFVEYKGKIYVGTTDPNVHEEHTVWFQTEDNPLTTNYSEVYGVFKVWENNQWNEYYPQTVLTDVEGHVKQKYVLDLIIKATDWVNKTYTIDYPWLTDTTVVTILPNKPMTTSQEFIYNSLTLSFGTNQIILQTPYVPSTDLNIRVTIQ